MLISMREAIEVIDTIARSVSRTRLGRHPPRVLDPPGPTTPPRRPRPHPVPAGRASSLVLVEPLLDGVARELDPVVHLQLAQGVLHVVLHGAV
jgi:hypothetical protein